MAAASRPASAASSLPIARVAIDSPLPHLDRPFDYLVPEDLSDHVVAGSRVRVRFAGRLIDGWVLERVQASDHDGRLAFLQRGIGSEPVLTPDTAVLFRAVADRWAGTFADVVRLAVPPRHARAETAVAFADPGSDRTDPATGGTGPDLAGWQRYRAGSAFVGQLERGGTARAIWNAMPSEDWPLRLAELAAVAQRAGRGVILVVPDARDVARVDLALSTVLPAESHVTLSAGLGPEARYRRWLSVRRGAARVVLGPRSAVYAPVTDLGLIIVWDDGDDLQAEPRAPYAHARDVAVLRSSLAGTSLLIGGFGQTAESAMLLRSGWARLISADRFTLRSACPRITAVGDDFEIGRDAAARSARLPALSFRTARASLEDGLPVLVQVPRRGYLPAVACVKDRTPARCATCNGPLTLASAEGIPTCRWCGRTAGDWCCPVCGSGRLRAMAVGSSRTAEEIGRAFPGVITRISAGSRVLDTVPPGPSVVVATPGAEPVVECGYGAALLLDGWSMLSRPDLRVAEEAFRRWANAIALVGPSGSVVINAHPSLPSVQALIRWDAAGHAERELADRAELGFPPVTRLAAITGTPSDVAEFLSLVELPASATELGSVPVPEDRSEDDQIRLLLRVARGDGVALAEALHAAAAIRSARKAPRPVRTELDPMNLG